MKEKIISTLASSKFKTFAKTQLRKCKEKIMKYLQFTYVTKNIHSYNEELPNSTMMKQTIQ